MSLYDHIQYLLPSLEAVCRLSYTCWQRSWSISPNSRPFFSPVEPVLWTGTSQRLSSRCHTPPQMTTRCGKNLLVLDESTLNVREEDRGRYNVSNIILMKYVVNRAVTIWDSYYIIHGKKNLQRFCNNLRTYVYVQKHTKRTINDCWKGNQKTKQYYHNRMCIINMISIPLDHNTPSGQLGKNALYQECLRRRKCSSSKWETQQMQS